MLGGDDGGEGGNSCAAFHPEAYVRDHLARGWQIVDFHREGARGNPSRTSTLLRKPGSAEGPEPLLP